MVFASSNNDTRYVLAPCPVHVCAQAHANKAASLTLQLFQRHAERSGVWDEAEGKMVGCYEKKGVVSISGWVVSLITQKNL
eukprot:747532-Hanusia_phi.AAC.4